MKVLSFNDNFERILRQNLFECICKLEKKFEDDKENVLEELSQKYAAFSSAFKNKVLEMYEKELLVIEVKAEDLIPQEHPK